MKLDQVRIAKPCPASWNEMQGDDRARHCELCKLNVYNLSDMTREEAQSFLRLAEGRVCVRYYQRPDGKVMTKDCPRGVAAARRQMALAFTATLAVASSLAVAFGMKPISKGQIDEIKEKARQSALLKPMMDKLFPPVPVMMGDIAMPISPTPAPKSSKP